MSYHACFSGIFYEKELPHLNLFISLFHSFPRFINVWLLHIILFQLIIACIRMKSHIFCVESVVIWAWGFCHRSTSFLIIQYLPFSLIFSLLYMYTYIFPLFLFPDIIQNRYEFFFQFVIFITPFVYDVSVLSTLGRSQFWEPP